MSSIEFHGSDSITQRCVNAVKRIIQFDTRIDEALIVTHEKNHALILVTPFNDIFVIRSGFASGYSGEAPRGLSSVLLLLRELDVDIDEVEVSSKIIDKLNSGSFFWNDFESVQKLRRVRPLRWSDYILERRHRTWADFPPVIPFAIIDRRIIPLALTFWENPCHSLMQGYRMLEDIVRKRAKSKESGAKLFSKAFSGNQSLLVWADLDTGESSARANLFIGAYGTFRNPRAHNSKDERPEDQLSEFLTLNQLYRLEREAKVRIS